MATNPRGITRRSLSPGSPSSQLASATTSPAHATSINTPDDDREFVQGVREASMCAAIHVATEVEGTAIYHPCSPPPRATIVQYILEQAFGDIFISSRLPKDWTRKVWQALQVEPSDELDQKLNAAGASLNTLWSHADDSTVHSCRAEQLQLLMDVLQILQLDKEAESMVMPLCVLCALCTWTEEAGRWDLLMTVLSFLFCFCRK